VPTLNSFPFTLSIFVSPCSNDLIARPELERGISLLLPELGGQFSPVAAIASGRRERQGQPSAPGSTKELKPDDSVASMILAGGAQGTDGIMACGPHEDLT
jgi:hypothetical protein